jgi:uncharacterized protein
MHPEDPNVRFRLTPRETSFYDMFAASADNIVTGTKLLMELLGADSTTRTEIAERMRAAEHAGDDATHAIFHQLNSSFITPFDREDIRSLATDLDDILDYLEEVAQRLINFELAESPLELREFAEILVAMAAEIEKATGWIWNLSNQSEIQQSIVRISDLENKADDLYNEVIADLFRANGRDPLQIMKWKEIYDGLENACDQCKDYTHVVGNVIVKNA